MVIKLVRYIAEGLNIGGTEQVGMLICGEVHSNFFRYRC
jgi:hypothetical protein